MYIESSIPRKEGDYANLFSDTYEINKTPLTDEYCLIFWYHMYGTGIGKGQGCITTLASQRGIFLDPSVYLFWILHSDNRQKKRFCSQIELSAYSYKLTSYHCSF